MRYINKSFIIVSTFLLIGTILTGCATAPNSQTVPIEKSLPMMNTITGSKLELSQNVEGFKFKTTYDAGKYGFSKWRITDTKSLKMTAIVENVPSGTEVLIEHVHVNLSLKAISPILDGLPQDSMDDSFHGVSQDGFYLSSKYPYENVFAIEGFSKDIIESWKYYCGEYGFDSFSSSRLTEDNLLSKGVYANKIQVVYDILVKNKGESKYHVRSIMEELLIPVSRLVVQPNLPTK